MINISVQFFYFRETKQKQKQNFHLFQENPTFTLDFAQLMLMTKDGAATFSSATIDPSRHYSYHRASEVGIIRREHAPCMDEIT